MIQLWTWSQRRGLLAVLIGLIAILAIRLGAQRMTVGEPEPPGPAADRLADRIDPNTATPAQLAAIPRLGESRAAAIVQFRDRYLAQHPGRVPFVRPEDLEQIRGIGSATAEAMEPYLLFPPAPSTRQSK
jgi:DNA uptake protein ComE-like DNA-binding protein